MLRAISSLVSLPACLLALGALAFAPDPVAAQSDTAVFMRLFDGQTLNGWKGREGTWSVKAGIITGSGALSGNTFLVTDSLFSDFHIVLDARMATSGYRNSGVLYRGEVTDAFYRMRGYQLDISDNYWGSFYHEMGNELGWTPVSNCSQGGVNDWRTIEIIADGPKIVHMVGGKKCWEKADFKVLKKGNIGLQMHEPGGFTMEFRNLYIRPLNNSFKIPEDGRYLRDGTHLGSTSLRAEGSRKAGAAGRAGGARLRLTERGLAIEATGSGGVTTLHGLDGKALGPR